MRYDRANQNDPLVWRVSPLSSAKYEMPVTAAVIQTTKLLERRWVSEKVFEIKLSRPSSLTFKAGQTIRFVYQGLERHYSLTSAPQDPDLSLCVRFIEKGAFSGVLAAAEPGTPFTFTGPHGYFTYRPSSRPAMFVATGTGIAPFCSMARSGITGFTLLHGVGLPDDLYYASQFQQSARKYIPCLTEVNNLPPNTFRGKVTDYLDQPLTPGIYDFYLCGRSEMIRDVTLLIDDRFPGSLIYTEMFY